MKRALGVADAEPRKSSRSSLPEGDGAVKGKAQLKSRRDSEGIAKSTIAQQKLAAAQWAEENLNRPKAKPVQSPKSVKQTASSSSLAQQRLGAAQWAENNLNIKPKAAKSPSKSCSIVSAEAATGVLPIKSSTRKSTIVATPALDPSPPPVQASSSTTPPLIRIERPRPQM